MSVVVRGILVFVGILFMLGGVAAMVASAGIFPGVQLFAIGAVLVISVAIERSRYRSAAAERTNEPPGPGGGEPLGAAVEPRFRPTAEVFIDPTSGRRMRVMIDPRSGERRYVAEG